MQAKSKAHFALKGASCIHLQAAEANRHCSACAAGGPGLLGTGKLLIPKVGDASMPTDEPKSGWQPHPHKHFAIGERWARFSPSLAATVLLHAHRRCRCLRQFTSWPLVLRRVLIQETNKRTVQDIKGRLATVTGLPGNGWVMAQLEDSADPPFRIQQRQDVALCAVAVILRHLVLLVRF